MTVSMLAAGGACRPYDRPRAPSPRGKTALNRPAALSERVQAFLRSVGRMDQPEALLRLVLKWPARGKCSQRSGSIRTIRCSKNPFQVASGSLLPSFWTIDGCAAAAAARSGQRNEGRASAAPGRCWQPRRVAPSRRAPRQRACRWGWELALPAIGSRPLSTPRQDRDVAQSVSVRGRAF